MSPKINLNSLNLAIIGLGYVGLPLAVEFGRKYKTIGYDINKKRISELQNFIDSTFEVQSEEIKSSAKLNFTNKAKDLKNINIFIITVPTPINNNKEPDLKPLMEASSLVGKYISKNSIVIFESTVYPGLTQEECIPKIENTSGLIYNKDFFAGYSPERINPGDNEHKLTKIKKITSGSTPKIADIVDALYSSIITAGTYKAESIEIAEAAKVIENTQRDINIALINELSIIFNKLNIDTGQVLEAAGTKWNFLPFKPGLVGGHCIGVDPYYLTYKAEAIGLKPEIILAGRRINDNMSTYIVKNLVKSLAEKNVDINESKILIMGLSFKENCPDIRNTKIIDIYKELKKLNAQVYIYDPWVNKNIARQEFKIDLIDIPTISSYDAIVLAVAHNQFKSMGIRTIKSFGKSNHIFYDLKHLFPKEDSDLRL